MELLLAIALGAVPAPEGLARAEYAAHLQAWSMPALGAAIALASAGSAAAVWRATRVTPAVGQLWTDSRRAIRGLTIRITAVTPGHVLAVIAAPPREALHDATGREMDLAAGRGGLRGFRLIGTERSVTR